MPSSAGYQLLEQNDSIVADSIPDPGVGSSSNLHIGAETDFNQTLLVQDTSQQAKTMGKQLGTIRAWYVVALCSIGSFLFAYVSTSSVPGLLLFD